MSLVAIGQRRRLFVLEMPVETADGFGGTLTSFVAGPEIWGAIEMLRGDERLVAGRIEHAVTHRITIRYRAGVTAAMRFAAGLRRFAIRNVGDPDGCRRELVCLVEEIAP